VAVGIGALVAGAAARSCEAPLGEPSWQSELIDPSALRRATSELRNRPSSETLIPLGVATCVGADDPSDGAG
jgi:hypothetical protein